MPAALRVRCPNAPPLYAWIEAEVVRVGSDADCDVRIDGTAPHAATVVYRGGEFYVVNRSRSPLTLAGQALPGGAESRWSDGAALVLPPGIEVSLVQHSNPTPVAQQSWRSMPEFDEPDQQRLALRERQKQAACLVISVAAIFLTGILWARPSTSGQQQRYRQVLDSLDAAQATVAGASEAQVLADAVGWLRAAHSSERRGQRDVARQRYLAVRDLVINGGAIGGDDWRRLVLRFCAERLEAI